MRPRGACALHSVARMRAVGLVVVAACAHAAPVHGPAACGGAEAVVSPAVDASELLTRPDVYGSRIVKVSVRGPASLADVALDGAILTKAGDPYDQIAIDEDVRRLWRLGVVSDVRVTATHLADGVAVAFEVTAAPLVRRVSIETPDESGDGARAAHVRAMAGGIYDPMRVHRAGHRLEEELKNAGHLKARVDVRASRVGDGLVDVCVAANAGRRYTIDRIDFPGATRLAAGALAPLVRRASGEIDAPGGAYRAELLEEDLVKISGAGMVMVKVGDPVVVIDERRAKVIVKIPIDEGAVYRIGTIAFKGVAKSDEDAYRRELRLASGEIFARGILAGGIDRLRSMERDRGHRGEVDPETTIDEEKHTIDLTIEVTP